MTIKKTKKYNTFLLVSRPHAAPRRKTHNAVFSRGFFFFAAGENSIEKFGKKRKCYPPRGACDKFEIGFTSRGHM